MDHNTFHSISRFIFYRVSILNEKKQHQYNFNPSTPTVLYCIMNRDWKSKIFVCQLLYQHCIWYCSVDWYVLYIRYTTLCGSKNSEFERIQLQIRIPLSALYRNYQKYCRSGCSIFRQSILIIIQLYLLLFWCGVVCGMLLLLFSTLLLLLL